MVVLTETGTGLGDADGPVADATLVAVTLRGLQAEEVNKTYFSVFKCFLIWEVSVLLK